MKAKTFSTGRSLLLESGRACGNAPAISLFQPKGRSQLQKVARPAGGLNRCSVNPIVIDLSAPFDLQFPSHRLVNRACCPTIVLFSSITDQSPLLRAAEGKQSTPVADRRVWPA